MIVFIKGNSKTAVGQDEEVTLRGLLEMETAEIAAAADAAAEEGAAAESAEVIELA
jgi:hypothetical protein